MSEGSQAVFLSYASQDAAAVRRIAEALRAAGVEVWFDQNELVGGDAWDAKIRGQIASCALFVPVISAATQARLEGYFRVEWKLAARRTHAMATAKAFLLPVVIDGTRDAEAHVPDEFREVQWTRLPGGEAPAAFGVRVRKLLGGETMETGRPRPVERGEGAASPIKSAASRTWLVPTVIGIAASLALAVWRPWEKPRPSATPVSASPSPKSSPAVAAATEKSLVVLPLENLSPDPENVFFTDGMHAEIIATLQRIPDLKVISRDSAMAFKGSTAPLAEKAQKMAAAHAISGSVRRAGTSVRVQLELRRARDEALLWAQTYDKELGGGVIAIQSDIADQVARVLQARERKGAFAGAQFMTANPEAYDLFLKASQAHYTERTPAGRRKAIAGLEQALKLDPKFSSAAHLLAGVNVQAFRVSRARIDPAERMRYAHEAKRWAEATGRLLPGGAGDAALAGYYTEVEPDNARALALIENAVNALPNDGAVQNQKAIVLFEAGRSAESVPVLRRAITLDPFNRIFWANLLNDLARLRRVGEYAEIEADFVGLTGRTAARPVIEFFRFRLFGELPATLEPYRGIDLTLWLLRGRRDAEILAAIEDELAVTSASQVETWRILIMKCDVLRRLQRESEAVAAAQAALAGLEKIDAEPEFDVSERDRRRAVTLARLGRADEAIAAGRRYVSARSVENQVRSRWVRETELAEIYAYLRRPRECVELLARLLRVPSDISVPMLKVDPIWDNVREDAGFKALLADPKNSAPL